MAHEIDMSTGKAGMAFTGELPWHGLGQRLDPKAPLDSWIEASGLNWETYLTALYTGKGREVDHCALIRRDTKEILSVVGPSWHPLQNRELFEWFAPLLDAGLAEMHTAGSLLGGRKVWALAKLTKPNAEIRPGDAVEKFLLLSNANYQGYAARVGFTPIRVVCHNTLTIAHDRKVSQLLRTFHSSRIADNLKTIRNTLNLIDETFEASAEQYRQLAKLEISRKDLRRYVKIVLDIDLEEEPTAGQKSKVNQIMDLAVDGMGNGEGTWWDALNGVTQYLSYNIGRDRNRRIDKLWFGQNADLNRKALAKALELSGITAA